MELVRRHVGFFMALLLGIPMSSAYSATAGILQKQLLLEVDPANKTPVSIAAELDSLFGMGGCTLPKEVKDRLSKKGQLGVIPQELQDALGGDLKASAKLVNQKTAIATLHQIVIQMADGAEKNLPLTSSESYSNLDPMRFADTVGDNVIFTLDCSGYLNAALATDAGGGIFGGNVNSKSAADAALKAKRAFAVIRADVFSPVAIAMRPEITPGSVVFPAYNRLDILHSILAEAKSAYQAIPPDTAKIKAWRQVKMIWTSNQGSSSFQGVAQFSSGATLGAAGASIQTSASGGGSLSRGISFAQFTTYVLEDDLLDPVERPFGELRSELTTLLSITQATKVGPLDSGGVYATYELPKSMCTNLAWTASKSDNSLAGAIQTTFDNGLCRFALQPSGSVAGQAISLSSPSGFKAGENLTLNFMAPAR